MPSAINISGLDKWFGGTHALRSVSLSFEPNRVHAIVGENGAGKSTLVKILAGVLARTQYAGEIEVSGADCRFGSVRDAERAGVFLVPQELNIVPELSIADYLFLNREPSKWGIVDKSVLWVATTKWLNNFQLPLSPLTAMGELSSHEQQLISVARAMSQGVKIMIFDEPTASLTNPETELLFGQIRTFREGGVTILYISHRLAEIERIADTVTVMRDGMVVDQFEVRSEPDSSRRIVKAMIGREVEQMYPKMRAKLGDTVLQVKDWSVSNVVPGRPALVDHVSFEVRQGEVLGIYGLIGSGAPELGRSIFGSYPDRVTGAMVFRGKTARFRRPNDAVKAGIAYLPADRKRDSLILEMSVGSNISLAALYRLVTRGFIRRRKELAEIERFIDTLRVKCDSVDQPTSALSGGNQQKVAAAKWLLIDPDVLIMDQPTRGVDVGARVELYNLINLAVQRRKAIVLISTDLPEIMGMSDNILVMRDGKMIGEWPSMRISEEEVVLRAAGGH